MAGTTLVSGYPVSNNKSSMKGHLRQLPALKPEQGRGKPQYGKNGRPGQRDLMSQVTGSGGGIHGKVITKAFTREQKQSIGASAGLSAALTGGGITRGLKYEKRASSERKSARAWVGGSPEHTYHRGQAKAFQTAAIKNYRMTAGAALVGGGAAAGLSALSNRRKRGNLTPVAKMAPLESDAKLKRRKNLQAGLTVGTSTVGLAALGAKGTGVALRRTGAAKHNLAQMSRGRKLESGANTLSILGAGVGGAGGYNFAAIQRQEARKRRPVAKAFDSERNRLNRNRKQEEFLRTGGGALASGSVMAAGALAGRDMGVRRMKSKLNAKTATQAPPVQVRVRKPGANGLLQDSMETRPGKITRTSTLQGESRKATIKTLRKVERLPGLKGKAEGLAVLGALGVGGTVAADRLSSYRRGKGDKYAPRYRRPE